jgi:hypothetical protein
MFVRELGTITDYTGATGFAIGLTIPAQLFLRSKKIAKQRHYATTTYYTSIGSNDILASIMVWFGITMIFTVFISLSLY